MSLTLKHDRRMAAAKRDEQRAAKQDTERKERMQRALKKIGIGKLDAPISKQIEALDAYILDLEQIRDDMQTTYAHLLRRSTFRKLDIELYRALEQIADLRIQQVKPER